MCWHVLRPQQCDSVGVGERVNRNYLCTTIGGKRPSRNSDPHEYAESQHWTDDWEAGNFKKEILRAITYAFCLQDRATFKRNYVVNCCVLHNKQRTLELRNPKCHSFIHAMSLSISNNQRK